MNIRVIYWKWKILQFSQLGRQANLENKTPMFYPCKNGYYYKYIYIGPYRQHGTFAWLGIKLYCIYCNISFCQKHGRFIRFRNISGKQQWAVSHKQCKRNTFTIRGCTFLRIFLVVATDLKISTDSELNWFTAGNTDGWWTWELDVTHASGTGNWDEHASRFKW